MLERTILAAAFAALLTAGGWLAAGAAPMSPTTVLPEKIGASVPGLELVHGRRHGRWVRGPHCYRAWHPRRG